MPYKSLFMLPDKEFQKLKCLCVVLGLWINNSSSSHKHLVSFSWNHNHHYWFHPNWSRRKVPTYPRFLERCDSVLYEWNGTTFLCPPHPHVGIKQWWLVFQGLVWTVEQLHTRLMCRFNYIPQHSELQPFTCDPTQTNPEVQTCYRDTPSQKDNTLWGDAEELNMKRQMRACTQHPCCC